MTYNLAMTKMLFSRFTTTVTFWLPYKSNKQISATEFLNLLLVGYLSVPDVLTSIYFSFHLKFLKYDVSSNVNPGKSHVA